MYHLISKQWRFLLVLAVLLALTSVSAASTIYYCYADELDSSSGRSFHNVLRSFQGVVNRNGPNLYVIQKDPDVDILNNLMAEYTGYTWTYLGHATDQEAARDAVFGNATLNALCPNMIIYDFNAGSNELVICAAATCAVRYNSTCIVEDAELSEMSEYFNTVADYRYLSNSGQAWSTNYNCMSYINSMHNTYNNDYASDIICMLGDYCFQTPWHMADALDYAFSMRMVSFLLDASNVHGTGTWTFQNAILDRMPAQSIVYGWWSSEGDDVTAVTEKKLITMGQGRNVSLLYHLSAAEIDQNLPDTVGVYNANKKYCFISFSQGDALGFCQWHNLEHWNAESQYTSGKLIRELYEFGMMHTPLQVDHQPSIINYYYDTQDYKNVLFTGKGYGFNKPSTLEANNNLVGWCNQAEIYMEAGDIHDMMIADSGVTDNLDVFKKVIEQTDARDGWCLRSIITKNNLDSSGTYDDDPVVYYNVPVFGDPVSATLDAGGDMIAADTADDIATSMANRQFFWVFLNHSVTAERFEDLMVILNSDSRFNDLNVMHPDKFIKVYREYAGIGAFATRCIDDAFVKQEGGAGVDSEVLRVRSAASNKQIFTFLKFVVDNSGGTTDVNTATLRVKVEDKAINGITCKSVSDNTWTEETINWSNQPSQGSVLDSVSNLSPGDWVEFDVSSFVTGPGTYSFVLRTAQDSAGLDLHSKEASDFANAPQLICEFN